MFPVINYYQTARENEEVFRNVLRDLRDNRQKRPQGRYISQDLETEVELDKIFQRYSKGIRNGKFTITNFTKVDKAKVIIEFQDIATISGGGAELEYLVKEDNSVQYEKPVSMTRS